MSVGPNPNWKSSKNGRKRLAKLTSISLFDNRIKNCKSLTQIPLCTLQSKQYLRKYFPLEGKVRGREFIRAFELLNMHIF